MFFYQLTLFTVLSLSGFQFWQAEFEPYLRQERIVTRFKTEYRVYILGSKRVDQPGLAETLFETLYNKDRERITALAFRGKGSLMQMETAELDKSDLRDLMRMPFLDSAMFSDCRFPRDELARLLSRRRLSLKTMEFFRTNLNDAVLDPLSELPALTQLSLEENELSVDAVSRLIETSPNIENLVIQPKEKAASHSGLLENIGRLKKLQTLTLGNFETFSTEDLAPLSSLPELLSVTILRTELTDEGLDRLCRLKNVTELRFQDIGLSDAALVYLKPTWGRLRFLNLSDNPITGDGLSVLEDMPQLLSLTLHRTRLNDDALARLPDSPNLEFLMLSETEITDAGLKHLLRFPKLRHLVVSKTAVTDAGLETLAEIPSLKYISAENTKIDGRKISEFNKSR